MNEKFKELLRHGMSYGMILLISLGYIATAFITVERSGKSVGRILADGIVIFLIGIVINRSFELQGIADGDCDERVTSAIEQHARTVDHVAPYIDRLDVWCDQRNRDALKIQRMRILAQRGMRYADYFDEEGMSREFAVDKEKLKSPYLWRLEVGRIRCYTKALSLHLTPLTSGTLVSEGGRAWDPYFLGRSKSEYIRGSNRGDVFSKLLLSVLFGYFGLALLADWSVATLIWKMMQIAVFLVMGSIKKTKSYQFMVEEYRGRITKKTNILRMFANDCGLPSMAEKEKIDAKGE